MITKEELSILKALRWYFGVLLKHPDIKEGIKCSQTIGFLISRLPEFYHNLIYVCGLTNGEAGITKEKEYEYVGRGLVDPFYRLTHTNDDCFNYVYHTLKETQKDDFSQINLRRELSTDEQGIKALLPLIALIMVQHSSLLQKAFIDCNLQEIVKQFTSKRYIADLSNSERYQLGESLLNKVNCQEIYNTLDSFLEEEKPSLSMAVLGCFIGAVGVATVAIALTVLNFVPGLVMASLGMSTTIIGLGLFSTNACKYWQNAEDDSLNLSDNFIYQ